MDHQMDWRMQPGDEKNEADRFVGRSCSVAAAVSLKPFGHWVEVQCSST